MPATYDDTLPTDRDKARSLIGDVNMDAPLMSDEHMDSVLSWQGSLQGAVAYLAQELIAKFSSSPIRKTAGNITVDYTENIKQWQLIVAASQQQLSGGGLVFVPATYTGEALTDEWGRPEVWWP
jgi:hypothetical protein